MVLLEQRPYWHVLGFGDADRGMAIVYFLICLVDRVIRLFWLYGEYEADVAFFRCSCGKKVLFCVALEFRWRLRMEGKEERGLRSTKFAV